MHQLMMIPPHSTLEPVTDVFHDVPVTDPYHWLEDQDSPRTRARIKEQTLCARAYLDGIPGRERIRERIREFLAVETHDSLQRAGSRYFFRKRLPALSPRRFLYSFAFALDDKSFYYAHNELYAKREKLPAQAESHD